MKKLLYFTIILFAGFLTACKKDSQSTSYLNLVKDSIYYYEKEDYLWADAIPAYNTFNPRSYGGNSDQGALTNEMDAISQLKINPATGKPYEYYPLAPGEAKYSFIDDGTTTASLSGTNGDFGFEPLYIAENDLRIKYVYPGSPADLAGVKRGYEITSINNSTDLDANDGSVLNSVINAVYYSTTIKMVLLKPDNTSVTVNLTTAAYTVDPVLTYNVYNLGGGHVVGYIVFNSFTDIDNAKPKLNQAFNYFINKGVNDLVVDLRYNGGGSGQTAQYLDDLIVPAGKSGSVMYTTYFNSNLQGGNSPLIDKKFGYTAASFKPSNNQVTFAKALSLSLNRVFFIVTNSTASSSELSINNLRPELTVNLIGDTTYGKPVGEIPIPLGSDGRYILYSPQLYVENSANQGDYYAGMAPGSTNYPGLLAQDDVTKEFGDSTEMLLSHALTYIKTGAFAFNRPQIQSLSPGKQLYSMPQLKSMSRRMERHKFKPMVMDKKKS